jgi:DNA-binding SARP family transcriptional activator
MDDRASTVVHLIDGPFVTVCNRRQQIPEGCKRLLAFVALKRGPLKRTFVAGSLWPTVDDRRASGNLRSAAWRLRTAGVEVMAGDRWSVWLCAGISVDVEDITQWTERVFNDTPLSGDLTALDAKAKCLEILPGFYDDWAILERERTRQRILHALETASRLLVVGGRYREAVDAATAAVLSEPLRESAQRALVEAHLAEGNFFEARRAFVAYSRLLATEIGARPSSGFATLLESSRTAPTLVGTP